MGMSAFLDGVQLGQGETARSCEMHVGDAFLGVTVVFDLPALSAWLLEGALFLRVISISAFAPVFPPFPPHPPPAST